MRITPRDLSNSFTAQPKAPAGRLAGWLVGERAGAFGWAVNDALA